jgi:hypothetical protein
MFSFYYRNLLGDEIPGLPKGALTCTVLCCLPWPRAAELGAGER